MQTMLFPVLMRIGPDWVTAWPAGRPGRSTCPGQLPLEKWISMQGGALPPFFGPGSWMRNLHRKITPR